MSKIDRLLDELEDFIESSRASFGSNKKITIVKDDILDFIDKLKISVPEELKMAKIVLDNEKEILEKAEKRGRKIVEDANAEAEKILAESSLLQEAYARADEIIKNADEEATKIMMSANKDAGDIRRGALCYSSDMLKEVGKIFERAYEIAENSYNNSMDSLKYNMDVLYNNRNMIVKQLDPSEDNEESAYPSHGEKEEEFTVRVTEEDFADDEEADSEYYEEEGYEEEGGR